MKIKDLLQQSDRKVVFSCEIFPPKKDVEFSGIFETVDAIHQLGADFISVTYGAAGSTSKKTVEVASYIQDTHHIPALAHPPWPISPAVPPPGRRFTSAWRR